MLTTTHTAVFDRVVCGVDRSDAGVLAARAAGLVTAPGGSLALVTVNDPSIAVHAGWAMPHVLDELAEEAQAALECGIAAAEQLHGLEAIPGRGRPVSPAPGGGRPPRRHARRGRQPRLLPRNGGRAGRRLDPPSPRGSVRGARRARPARGSTLASHRRRRRGRVSRLRAGARRRARARDPLRLRRACGDGNAGCAPRRGCCTLHRARPGGARRPSPRRAERRGGEQQTSSWSAAAG